jgi:colanic acid biosynthesis glycosyl transferase WcaI
MRVVVWGINYAPEITGISPHNVALCEFLHGKGVDVEMLTTFAYYPMWEKAVADRGRVFRTDVINGVPVYRCWHYVPKRVSAMKRIVHEGTFVFTSTLRLLSRPKADLYVVVSPPLLLGLAAWYVTRFKPAPFVFEVQDLQPDAAVGLGMLRAGWFTRALYWLEAFAYRKATRVAGISGEIVEAFRRKGVPEQKLLLFPNGVEMPEEVPQRGRFRQRNGFAAEEFLAIYAGNLGVKQGLDILLDVAEQLRGDPDIRIVLGGDGAEREALRRAVDERSLSNVTMLPLYHGREYQELLVDADVSLITQQSGSGNAFFPSKLLVTLAHGSPVVTVADEESALAKAVEDGAFGVNVVPGDATELAGMFRELSRDRQRLRRWGESGRIYVQRYDREKLLADFFEELKRLAKPRPQ